MDKASTINYLSIKILRWWHSEIKHIANSRLSKIYFLSSTFPLKNDFLEPIIRVLEWIVNFCTIHKCQSYAGKHNLDVEVSAFLRIFLALGQMLYKIVYIKIIWTYLLPSLLPSLVVIESSCSCGYLIPIHFYLLKFRFLSFKKNQYNQGLKVQCWRSLFFSKCQYLHVSNEIFSSNFKVYMYLYTYTGLNHIYD